MQQKPSGFPHPTCQVGHGSVIGDHQIAIGDDGGALQEIPAVTHLILTLDKTMLERTAFQLLTAKALLERQQGCWPLGSDRRESFQAK